jgi:hypothetical protein
MNNRGQMGMGLLTGMMVAVMVFFMMSAFLPSIIEMIGMGKGSNSANCPGYVDPDATASVNYSYDSTLDTDSITCSILDFTPGMFVLTIVFAIISGVISGRLAMGGQQTEPQYYPQY